MTELQSSLAEADEAHLAQLADKLFASNQLRHSSLMQALNEGRLKLFCVMLARLTGLSPTSLEAALNAEDADLMALACAGAGIDEAVFLRLLAVTRALNSGRPGGGDVAARRALGAFAPFAPEVAIAAFRQKSPV